MLTSSKPSYRFSFKYDLLISMPSSDPAEQNLSLTFPYSKKIFIYISNNYHQK